MQATLCSERRAPAVRGGGFLEEEAALEPRLSLEEKTSAHQDRTAKRQATNHRGAGQVWVVVTGSECRAGL